MSTESILQQNAHRPWPMPTGPWIMSQVWENLLFAHWRVPLSVLRPLVPEQLVIEEFGGSAWIGLTPFMLTNMRARFLPPMPGLSDFPEMNLRTYVRVGDKPGIFFFSLDAGSCLAVLGARIGFRLPYFAAEMGVERTGDWIQYSSSRQGGSGAEFVGRYRPSAPIFHAEEGTLEYFLTERYALYTVVAGGLVLRGDIHHGPWPLQRAEAEIERNTVPEAHGIELAEDGPLLHFAARQPTLIWPLKRA